MAAPSAVAARWGLREIERVYEAVEIAAVRIDRQQHNSIVSRRKRTLACIGMTMAPPYFGGMPTDAQPRGCVNFR